MMRAGEQAAYDLLPNPFLSKVVQICIVTSDHMRVLQNFVGIGIGPWQILKLAPPRISEARYYGTPHSFELIRCLAFVNDFVWEVIEPVSGTSVFHDFLVSRGEGVQHVGMTYKTTNFDECVHEFETRGYQAAQTGLWDGKLRYAFMATQAALSIYIEIWEKPADFIEPQPERWFPSTELALRVS